MGLLLGQKELEPSEQFYTIGLKDLPIGGTAQNPQEAYQVAKILAKTERELIIKRSLRYMDNGHILKNDSSEITFGELERLSLGISELPKIITNIVQVDGGAVILKLPLYKD